MPEAVLQSMRNILARVRDPQGSMHSHALCLSLLTHLQRAYNNSHRLVLLDTTVDTQPFSMFYPFAQVFVDSGGALDSMTITNVTQYERPLERFTLPQLRMLNSYWPREIGPRLEGFCQLGYSFLLLYPALEEPSQVVVTATSVTADLAGASDATFLEIPSESTPGLLQILELLLLLRQRSLPEYVSLFKMLTGEK